MDQGGGNQVSALGGVVAIQIGGVLEVVGVQGTLGQGLVGQHIVVIDNDLQLVAVLLQGFLHLLQDLSVRSGAGADFDDFVFGLLAAGGEAENGSDGENDSNNLFHFIFSFS